MPGEASLPVQYYPDDFADLNLQFQAIQMPDPCVVFFAERAFVIDSVVLTTVTAQASQTITLRISTDPTNVTATAVGVLDMGTAAGSRLYISTDEAPYTVSSTGVVGTSATSVRLNSNENTIPAGSYLILDPSAAVSWRGYIQIRLRSRLK
jgi:hypothetical protein